MSAGYPDPKLIESLPPSVLKSIPAAQPPPGIQPNFADPPTRAPVILGVGILFLVLAFLCFSIRIYTKLAIAKNWKWDDLTCSLGFMCSIVYSVTVFHGCTDGAAGKHFWDVHLDVVLSKSSLYQSYVTTIIVTPALGLIKLSLFIQYYQLFRALRWLRICVWIGAPISAAFYVAVSITAFVLESPWPGESFIESLLSWHYLKFADFSIPTGVIGMLVDWYLLILPIPAVLGLQMSTAKKLGVLIVFMTGGLAAVASIVSLYYRATLDLSDPTWGVGYVLLWTQIEMFTGVAASSMPTVNQFRSHHNISFTFRMSSLKSSLKQLLSSSTRPSRSTREKLPDENPSFTDRNGSKSYTATDGEVYGMKGLKSENYEHKVAKAPQVADPQIHFTQGYSVTHEQRDDPRIRLVDTDRHRLTV